MRLSPHRHSGAGRNPGNGGGKVNDHQILQRPDCMACLVVIPAKREWLVSATGFQPSLE